MKKVTPINRALRQAEKTEERAGTPERSSGRPLKPAASIASLETPTQPPPSSREALRGLFNEYHAREQSQQFQYLEERLNDAIGELKAKVHSQEQQIQGLENTLNSERRLSQSAIANLKDLFDGNYRVMSDISEKYEDSHQAFEHNKASFDRRLDFIQQESQENTSQLRSAIIKSQVEDRAKLAESLRALADSIDGKPPA